MCENFRTITAMIGGDTMNQIKNILHKYLCSDAIVVCELSEKAGDFVWLEENGYFVRKTGEETAKGKAYTKKHDKMLTEHFEKINDDSLSTDNLNKLRQELSRYIKKNPDIDIYEGLTESESFAFRYVYHGRW